MVRTAHRTLLARSFAVFLVALAASPVTAPFTVFDLSDFGHSQPVNLPHHPGRALAEAQVKIAPHLVVVSPDVAPAFVVVDHQDSPLPFRLLDVPIDGRTLVIVLRV